MPYTKEDAKRRAAQLEQDRIERKERKEQSYQPPAPPPRKPARPAFAAPYGNTSSYTPATDYAPAPFVPSADCYSPPAQSADPTPPDAGGGTFDGGGASGDWS
jgi:hypothetical protein